MSTPILYFVGVGVASAAAGFFIGWKLRGRKAAKEMEKSLAYQKHQLDILDKKFKDLKGSINANIKEKEEFWENVAKNDGSTEEEQPPESHSERREKELMYRRPEDKRVNYSAVTSALDYSDPDEKCRPDTYIRYEADNGIVEIDEREFDEHEFPDEEMAFYEASGDVYKDEELIENDELPLYLGYSRDELAMRFLYDEPDHIYVRNPEYERIYVVYWKEGLMPE